MIVEMSQRWRNRVATYRPVNDNAVEVIDPRHYEVAPIAQDGPAKDFIVTHHYSHAFPAARFRFGLYRKAQLVGVAVFSVPPNNKVITNVLPGEAIESTELGRLVLLDEEPANSETWFVARCFDALRREGLIGVVSFSDPVRRTALDGRVVMPGHAGLVYQGLNAVYTGRGESSVLRVLPDGTVFSKRAASKIRSGERGARYAAAQLVAAGAPPIDIERAGEEERRGWLRRAVAAVTRPLKHGGNYRYCWALDKRARRHLPPALPYPKLVLPRAA